MPLYSYKCNRGHVTDEVYSVKEKPEMINCNICGRAADSIINCTQIGSCWPEGKRFEQVKDDTRVFKSYRELDSYVEKNKLAIETLTPAQLKARQEDRRHMLAKGIDPSKVNVKKKKLKVPEKVEKAFRECSTVKQAVTALKENRV